MCALDWLRNFILAYLCRSVDFKKPDQRWDQISTSLSLGICLPPSATLAQFIWRAGSKVSCMALYWDVLDSDAVIEAGPVTV